MAFCRVLLPLLVVSVVQSYAAVEVPVFLWGDLGQRFTKHSALSAVPSDEFRLILKQELQKEPFLVVFTEETLSVEDFSSKVDGDTTFSYLQENIGRGLYLPSVESPLRVLNKWADPEKVDHVKLTDTGLSADINRDGGRYLFINLKDAKEGETREELLRRHNNFMEDMFSKLQERYESVVAIYTARYPSWTVVEHSRVRRQAEAAKQNKQGKRSNNPAVTDLSFSGLRIYFEQVQLNSLPLSGAVGSATDSNVTENTMESTISFPSNNSKVTLNIVKDRAGYWLLKTAKFVNTTSNEEEELFTKGDVYALLGFSYRCAQDVTFKTSNTTREQTYEVTFKNVRIQPFFNQSSQDLVFGDMFNCVGFFTAPIWAGLFIVSLLLAITFFGIIMMLDIRTMDRFDDPKGKTITINAAAE